MGAAVDGISKLVTLLGKLGLTLAGLARKVVFWLTVGIFLWLKGRRRKKGEARRLEQAVDAGRQQGLAAAQTPPAEDQAPPPSPEA